MNSNGEPINRLNPTKCPFCSSSTIACGWGGHKREAPEPPAFCDANAEIERLRMWAKAESEHWDGRNADRFWQMQRVLHELG